MVGESFRFAEISFHGDGAHVGPKRNMGKESKFSIESLASNNLM
jgi:hypothetical protein